MLASLLFHVSAVARQLLAPHSFAGSGAADDVELALAEIHSQRDRVHGTLMGDRITTKMRMDHTVSF
ncbi:hypothetical protein WJ09_17380 [Burkholderia vietnamiensis]|nr:hypothetical protein WJ09_17380 [Burkholderia vietnamiensis]